MVYESGFTTRRNYSSRPVTTSYAVTYPSIQKVTRVYKSSYPIYSSYSIPRRIVTGARVVTSPFRVVTSPTRVVSRIIHSPSPVRVVRTTTRVISSPERTTYSYSTPTTYHSPALLSSYTSRYIPTSYTTYTPSYHYNPTTITRVYARSVSPVRITSSSVRPVPSYLKRLPPGYGARALTNYLNTEPFTTFSEETSRIRHRAQSLIRDLHTPVVRRARSCTPFPVTGYTFEPTSQLALDAYVARVTNPVRHIAKEVHNISHYPRPAVKYVGKSHLASVRICGDKAYNVRRPIQYDSDKVRNDINLLSWYLRHPTWKTNKQSLSSQKEDADLDPNRPTRKFSAPRPLEDPVDVESKEKQRLRQERMLTVNEEPLDEVEVEKKRAQNASEEKRREEKTLKEEKRRIAAEAEKQARLVREAEEAAQKAAEEAAQKAAVEAAQKAAEEAAQKAAEEAAQQAAEVAAQKAAEEAAQKAAEEAAQKAAEEAAQKAAEEAAQKAAEEAAQKAAEEAAQKAAEEAAQKAAEEAAQKAAEEAAAEESRLIEEAALKAEEERLAKEALLEEEQRSREQELNRLAEIEKQAEEESEGDLARQAAELAEIARQEAEIAALELQAIQKVEGETNEPLIEEPTTPIEDQEPTIELSATVDEAVAPSGGESYDEEDDEEE